MSKNITPMLWLRLLRKNLAIAFGRSPSFRATSSMRFFVAGAMYRANGALFSTMDTVADEKPLCVATSRIVTASFLPLGRFTGWASSADHIILPESPNLQRLPHHNLLFDGRFKRQRVPEAASLPDAEGNSRDHPDAAHDLRRPAQTHPQRKANKKSQHRWNEVPRFLLLGAHEITQERRSVHTHECDQRPKIEHLRAQTVREKESADQHDTPDKKHVVARHAVLFVDCSKKRPR